MKLFLDNHFITKIKSYSLVITLLFLLYSCATHKAQYGKNVSANETENATDTIKIAHTLFLVGDAGNADEEQSQQTLELLHQKLKKETIYIQKVFPAITMLRIKLWQKQN
jgi:PBP1b-binding outer membrane lipoprotein LpoB